ncbi:MAG: F0F1 ATP synthase subunit A [Clostridia bacterium]|nr:F0F1 ATP synthase subunit A [Clostridia bacterium]
MAAGPVFAIVLKVLYTPISSDIDISGALVFFTVKMPLWDLPVTETQVNSLVVIWSLFWLCRYITHGISVRGGLKRQIVAEWIVEKTKALTTGNMGEYFAGFAPFVAAIMGLSAFSSLLTLIGLYPPTSDINTVGGWAILVFILITYYKFKCGPVHYLKSFGDPVPFLAPLNIISEVATPVSMAFRHYGNVLSGSVISVLVATALQGASSIIFSNLPGILHEIPFLQIGLPAVLSVYFDLFSGLLQAFIFAMLTMLYVSGAFPAEDYAARKAARKAKRAGNNK